MPVHTSTGQSFDDEVSYYASLGSSSATIGGSGDVENVQATQVPLVENNAPVTSVDHPASILNRLSVVNAVKGMTNPSTGEDLGILKGLWDSAKNAFTLPGKVSQGLIAPDSIQAIEQSADLAGLMVMGPAPVAAKMADGTLGSFMGVKSATFDRSKLLKAQELEQAGTHADDIWQQTGTLRGADGRWRQEIPDQNASLNISNLDYKPGSVGKGWTAVGSSESIGIKRNSFPENSTLQEIFDSLKTGKNKPTILRDILDHPELYKAYPEIGNMKIKALEDYYGPGLGGNIEGIKSGNTIYMKASEPEKFLSVLLHEAQHGIQGHEGFARGGNPAQFRPPALDKAEADFKSVREVSQKEIIELANIHPSAIEPLKNLVKHQLDGTSIPKDSETYLKAFKERSPEAYDKLRNIAESEHLLEKASAEHFEKYQRIMGEVEARNVQTRMYNDPAYNRLNEPVRTEDRPRWLQISGDR